MASSTILGISLWSTATERKIKMLTCWECLESFQSETFLFEHLEKHSSETVKDESHFSTVVKTEGPGSDSSCLDQSNAIGDLYSILSTESAKDDYSDMSQASTP
eukprot:722010_1